MTSVFYGPHPASFCLFLFFSHDKYSTNLTINNKSINGVLGNRTQGSRMVGADKSTELWRHLRVCIKGNAKQSIIGCCSSKNTIFGCFFNDQYFKFN